MLTLFNDKPDRTCEGLSRREMLKIGTLGFGGLTLADLLATQARGAETPRAIRDKSVVFLFLAGGPTHIETFDPKMTAPVEYRSMTGEVKTSIPGVTFGGTFPELAKRAHRMSVVRSYRHGNGSHASATAHVISGGNPTGAMLGSVYSNIAGLTSPKSGIPNNTLVEPAAVGDEYKKLANYRRRLAGVGDLGTTYAPFDPSAGGEVLRNMRLKIAENKLEDRRSLLRLFDDARRRAESASLDELQQRAFDVILGGVSDAFDLSKEDPKLLAKYDTGDIRISKAAIKKKRKTTPRFQPVALGKQMLMARRLCEAGCGFVTVSNMGWDMHGNALGIDDGMPSLGRAVDKAVSAFLDDVEARGLSEKILLVITGEFGRTPKINKKAGRDHWGNLCPLVLAGGGLKMGQVVGQSDRRASVPASDPIRTENVMATILNVLFDPGQLRLMPGVPSSINDALAKAEPIRHLM